MKNILLYSCLIIFIGSTKMLGQWNFSLSTEQEYSDNPFHYPTPVSSMISSFNLGIERKINSFGIGYYGNYSNFSDFADRNYYWHQFGFWKTSEKIIFGLYAEQRINKLDYEYFDYSNFNAYIKHKTNINGINVYSQASFTVTNYSLLTDLDNWMGSLAFKLNKSFESKTTLIGGLVLNYKDYYSTNLEAADTNWTGVVNYSQKSTANSSQLNYYARVTQSLSSTTGLAIQYTDRNIIGGTAQTVRKLEYVYGDESQYFDDPVSYEGYSVTAQLTQILPSEITFRGAYYFNSKKYPSQGIFSDAEFLDDNIVRIDEQKLIHFSLTKSFTLNKNNDYGLNLSFSYQIIINSSNSYWYDYKSNQINLGIDLQF